MSRARALERRGRKLPCGWVSPRVNGIRIEAAPTVRSARREAARRGGREDRRAEWRELQGSCGRGGHVPPTLVFFAGGLSRAVLLDFSWLRAWGVEWAGEGWAKDPALKKFPVSDEEKYTCLFRAVIKGWVFVYTNNYKEECSYQPGKNVFKNGMVFRRAASSGEETQLSFI